MNVEPGEKKTTPRELRALIERFNDNRDAYLSSVCNEAQARLEFIDPLFKALDWDMYNEAGYAEGYKDVVHEDAIKVGGVTKAPDYAFRIGGVRKFFVEAKRPGGGHQGGHRRAYTEVPARRFPVFSHVLSSWNQSTSTLECDIGVERSRSIQEVL